MSRVDYSAILRNDPGNSVFAAHAEELRLKGDYTGAMGVCLAGLTNNPGCHQGRLVLARVYYELGYFPFAAREIHLLRQVLPNLESVRRLADRFDPSVSNSGENDPAPSSSLHARSSSTQTSDPVTVAEGSSI